MFLLGKFLFQLRFLNTGSRKAKTQLRNSSFEMTWIALLEAVISPKKSFPSFLKCITAYPSRAKCNIIHGLPHTESPQIFSGTVIATLQKITWRRVTCSKEAPQDFSHPFSLPRPYTMPGYLEGIKCLSHQNHAIESDGVYHQQTWPTVCAGFIESSHRHGLFWLDIRHHS